MTPVANALRTPEDLGLARVLFLFLGIGKGMVISSPDIDWPQVWQAITDSLPYLAAGFALIQSWGAASSARSAKKQADTALSQLQLLEEQVSVESEALMASLTPSFSVTAIGQGELGIEERTAANRLRFAPLDDHARSTPHAWRRRRMVQVECTEATGQLLVSISPSPGGVTLLTEPPAVFSRGLAVRLELMCPHDQDEQEIELTITSYLASHPGHSWTQRIPCFPRGQHA